MTDQSRTPRVTFSCKMHAVEQAKGEAHCPYCEAADLRERLAKVAANIAGSPANVVEWSEMVGRVLIEMDIEMDRLSERLAKAQEALERISHAKADRLDHAIDIGIIDRAVNIAKAALSQKGAEHE